MTDKIPFATDEWIKALGVECNRSEAYRVAARTWEGSLYFVVEPDGPMAGTAYMYIDLWHGDCREAYVPADPSAVKADFELRAPLGVWKKIIDRELDPMKAMLVRQIKVKGNMATLMKSVKAAQELVMCATRVPTTFPS